VKYDYRQPGTYDPGYAQAWWTTSSNRFRGLLPDVETFCSPTPPPNGNNCSVDTLGRGSCGYADFHCWWHWPASWKADCPSACRLGAGTHHPRAREPARGTHYPPACSTQGLPAGALIVDDVPD